MTTTNVGWYVYGIVDADVEVVPDSHGIGDPPEQIELVASDDVAALVSRVRLDRPLVGRSDLLAHQQVLDATAAETAVLPMRFGAVLSSREAITEELLEPYREEFADALRAFAGKVQYVLRARYIEQALMQEVVAESPTVAELRRRLSDPPTPSTQDVRLRIGELVSQIVEEKRATDTDVVVAAVDGVTEAVAVRPPLHEQDAAHVALLVSNDREAELEAILGRLAQEWTGRIEARLLGPMAPYDFVVA